MAYRFPVRYINTFKQALPEYSSVLLHKSLLHTSFQLIASTLQIVSRPKSLPHCSSKLLPGHHGRIPSLHTKQISCLTSKVHHSTSWIFGYWDTILHLKVEVYLEQPCIQHSCVQPPRKRFWQLKLQRTITRHTSTKIMHTWSISKLWFYSNVVNMSFTVTSGVTEG